MGTPRYALQNLQKRNSATLYSDPDSFRAFVERGDADLRFDALIDRTDRVLNEIEKLSKSQSDILGGMLSTTQERNKELEDGLSKTQERLSDIFSRFEELAEQQAEEALEQEEASEEEAKSAVQAAADAILGLGKDIETDVAPARAISIGELGDRGRGGSVRALTSDFVRSGGTSRGQRRPTISREENTRVNRTRGTNRFLNTVQASAPRRFPSILNIFGEARRG